MRVLAFKPGHDGSVVVLEDGHLVCSLEAEKDSFDRHSEITPELVLGAMAELSGPPDVVTIGGWHKILPGRVRGLSGDAIGEMAGYLGTQPGRSSTGSFMGAATTIYAASHERSHIVGGVAMSPFDPHQPIAVLVWEGIIGSLYLWSGPDEPPECHPVLDQPGARYSALFAIADPAFPASGRFPPTAYAGKVMALAGLGGDGAPSTDSVRVVDTLLRRTSLYPFDKSTYRSSPLYDAGVETAEFRRAARYLTDRLYQRFLDAARRWLPAGLPLVIAGGCGLNCEWNARLRDCGHFADVFVPPCADDSGSAIGSAVDAAHQAGAPFALTWDVYAGARFARDECGVPDGWVERPLDLPAVSDLIEAGQVVAWVQGRCEIGPRALGHRSLLASATSASSKDVLNAMKHREDYRPIAPVCLTEDLAEWFDDGRPDPYMLFFRQVTGPGLPAVTHGDGSARVQSVSPSVGRLHDLLLEHRRRTGVGVLCNTSLNYSGKGFINRTTDLFAYCELVGIDSAVIDDSMYRRTGVSPP